MPTTFRADEKVFTWAKFSACSFANSLFSALRNVIYLFCALQARTAAADGSVLSVRDPSLPSLAMSAITFRTVSNCSANPRLAAYRIRYLTSSVSSTPNHRPASGAMFRRSQQLLKHCFIIHERILNAICCPTRNARLPDNLRHLDISLKQIHGFRTLVLFLSVPLCSFLCLCGLKAHRWGHDELQRFSTVRCRIATQCVARLRHVYPVCNYARTFFPFSFGHALWRQNGLCDGVLVARTGSIHNGESMGGLRGHR